jgi:hypothetical protein
MTETDVISSLHLNNEGPDIRPGQIWRDSRARRDIVRTLRIDRIGDHSGATPEARMRGGQKYHYLHCTVTKTENLATGETTDGGRTTRIIAARLIKVAWLIEEPSWYVQEVERYVAENGLKFGVTGVEGGSDHFDSYQAAHEAAVERTVAQRRQFEVFMLRLPVMSGGAA